MKQWTWKFWEKSRPRQTQITLSLRKIYIIPNRHGLLFALVLLVMLGGAMNYNNSMGFLLTFLLASIALVSMLHTYYNLHHLSIRFSHCQAVFAGQTAYLTLRLDNPSQKQHYAIRLHTDTGQSSAYCDIPAASHALIKLAYPTQYRGKHHLPCISISTEFPLNIFYAWYPLYLQGQFWVYPQPKGQQALTEQQGQAGDKQSPQHQHGDDFMGYRDYHPTESPKHVDWKIVARDQGWYIKQFGGVSNEKKLWLRWQDVQGDQESKLSQLSQWIITAEQQGLSYGLELPNLQYFPAQSSEHKHRCLLALAQY